MPQDRRHASTRRSTPYIAAAAASLLVATASACGAAAPDDGSGGKAAPRQLVVWDWKSGDANAKEYFEKAEADFKKKHPDIEVEFVAQPYDHYYTLLGTAIESGKGPDVALFNGGAQLRERAGSLVVLDGHVRKLRDRLTGWEAFEDKGGTYAVPVTLQGFPFYYNKAVYKKAGLDPDAPPKTLDQLVKVCQAIKKSGSSCFSLGNKEGLGIEFFLSGFAPGVFPPKQYDAWLAGERDWSSPEVRQIFELWVRGKREGWYNDGVNSTATFMDQYSKFSGGEGGNVIGLLSDTAHWKSFGKYLGKNLGVYDPPLLSPKVAESFLPAEGGIGYGVLKRTPDADIAYDLVQSLASSGALESFADGTGAIAADTTVEPPGKGSSVAGELVASLKTSKPLLHTALSAKTLDLLHRLSQELLGGDVSIDAALAQLGKSDRQTSK
ncbi:ABC transporter substrate-binding protein [Streptomyces boninensis]|uniref:ABC transporter substrate-binding protein n=1 Tax=Streptomyces boninensis TaxID=2039455 RepID=UPI003B227055